MGLPRVLKNLILFNEGLAYVGEVEKVKLPVLSRKFEEWRGGGMFGPIGIDMGMDGLLELGSTFGGPMRDYLRQYGITTANGVYLRFAGAYQRDDSSDVDAVEVMVRGRHREIDMGEQEVGEIANFEVTSVLSYYKLVWNGRTEIEIDVLNGIEMIDGVDRNASIREALGIF